MAARGAGRGRAAFLLWPLLKMLVADKLLERLGGRLRLCISGGAALNPQIAHTFLGLGLPICQGYGLTEAAPVVSVQPPRHATTRRASACRCPASRSRSARTACCW